MGGDATRLPGSPLVRLAVSSPGRQTTPSSPILRKTVQKVTKAGASPITQHAATTYSGETGTGTKASSAASGRLLKHVLANNHAQKMDQVREMRTNSTSSA